MHTLVINDSQFGNTARMAQAIGAALGPADEKEVTMSPDFYSIQAPSQNDAFAIAAANALLPVMKKLLADGADVNALPDGRSALHRACSYGLPRVAQFLLDHGAALELRDEHDLTPLMLACSTGKTKGSRIALMLIAAGAEVDAVRAADEMTALKFAAKHCEPAVLQALVDRGAQVDGPPGTAQTALMLAARANHVAALEVLLRNGADPARPCGLPWAEGRTAAGLAELERRQAALAFLRQWRP